MHNNVLVALKLSKYNFDLSKAEAALCSEPYFKTKVVCCFENICVFSIHPIKRKEVFVWLNRLAFTKEAYVLGSRKDWVKEISKNAKVMGLKLGEKTSFKIHIKTKEQDKNSLMKRFVNDVIKQKMSGSVNVTRPDLEFFLFDDFVGLKFWENRDSFESRKAHLKKAPHPTALNPRVARAMINLASARKEVLDPFCGSGGILEEAKLVGLSHYGVDISESMLKRAKVNLESSKNLFLMDALDWSKEVECVVSDLPYGKSSFMNKKLDDLIKDFFKQYFSLTDKLVICLPSTIDIKRMVGSNWNVICSFEVYVHKTLTRVIYVLKKK